MVYNHDNHQFFLCVHNICFTGEADSADKETASNYIQELQEIISAGEYVPNQIFNVDETRLNWKQLPSCTFIFKNEKTKEKTVHGFKVSKERLSILLGGSAVGYFKFKSLLVYLSKSLSTLKNVDYLNVTDYLFTGVTIKKHG